MNKVLLLTVSYPYGDGEQFLANEIEHLSNQGMDIFIYPLVRRGRARDLPDGVQVVSDEGLIKHKIFFGFSVFLQRYFWFFLKDLLATIRDEGIQILRFSRMLYITGFFVRSFKFLIWHEGSSFKKSVIYYSYWMNSGSYAISILKRYDSSLVCISRAHGGDLYVERNRGFLPFRRIILKSMDRVYVISAHGKRYLLDRYGQSLAGKIFVSRLGVSRSSRIGMAGDRIVIASCSTDAPVKRVLSILQSLGQFSKIKKITWLHIGIVDAEFQKKYGPYLLSYPNLDVLPIGVVPNNEVIDIYQKYKPSLFINLSVSEGVPVSIMEALSCGLPIIATNVGGTSEIVDGMVGVLVQKDFSFNEINAAIMKVLENREWFSEMAFRQWELVCDKNKNYFEFYEQLKTI